MKGWITKLRNVRALKKSKSSIPFHFEIHGDDFVIELKSLIDKSQVFKLFFGGLKKLHKKSVIGVDELPDFFKADEKQRKALAKLVVNNRFLEDIVKQVQKDIPSFNILDSELRELTFTLVGPNQYEQKIVMGGTCYYEE